MKEINIHILFGKTVRLFLPIHKQNDIIFKLGDNIIGCVDADLQRHYDYKSVGTYFDAKSFYTQGYLDKIEWADCGLFHVVSPAPLNLLNDQGQSYKIKSNPGNSEFAITTMEEILTGFEVPQFKNLT